MEKINENADSSELLARAEESIDILTSDDARIKLIGEVFANDTSRKILIKIFEGVNTAGEIASKLEIDLPLAVYHLKRLEQSGLIKVGEVTVSSKRHKVNRYVPMKLAFVLIPSSGTMENKDYKTAIGKALDSLGNRLLIPISFAISSFATYAASRTDPPQGGDFGRSVIPINNDPITLLILNLDLIIAVCVGGITAYLTYRIRKRFQKKYMTPSQT
ncbi:MAG TPA: winged helix-turn-helix domain-containing protein [Nitrososphaera sp.]|nr:winged helix-turn-helix domain-containing protein [Nitrososphaera sp.]